MGQEALGLDIIAQCGGNGNPSREVPKGHLALQLIVLEGSRFQQKILNHIGQIRGLLGHEVGGSQEESGSAQKAGYREIS